MPIHSNFSACKRRKNRNESKKNRTLTQLRASNNWIFVAKSKHLEVFFPFHFYSLQWNCLFDRLGCIVMPHNRDIVWYIICIFDALLPQKSGISLLAAAHTNFFFIFLLFQLLPFHSRNFHINSLYVIHVSQNFSLSLFIVGRIVYVCANVFI